MSYLVFGDFRIFEKRRKCSRLSRHSPRTRAMLKRHAPSRQKRRGRLPLPPRSSPSAVTSPTSKRSKIAPLLGGKNDTTYDITSSTTSSSAGAIGSSSANGDCEAAGLRISRRSVRPFATVERAKGLLGRLNSFNPEPGRKSPTTAVKTAIDGEETDLSDLAQHIEEHPKKQVDGKTHRRGSAPKQPRGSPDVAHHGEAETIAARSRGRRSSSGRPEAVGPASRHPSSSRPPSRSKKQRGARGSGGVEEETEIDWREPTPSPKRKFPAASPSPKSPVASGGEATPNDKGGGIGLSRARRGRDRDAGSKQSGAGNDTQGAAKGVESKRKLELRVGAKDRRVARGKARGDSGVPVKKPTAAAAAAAPPPPPPTPTSPTPLTAAPASTPVPAPAPPPAAAATVPKTAAAPAVTAAATPAPAVVANGGSGSAPRGASEAKGVRPLPVPTPKEEELPRCPYPGHKNVSWSCRACGGAAHHLTSRFAMEPLQRAHGFKVHRVPNDGDCFFSSIKAALEAGSQTCEDSGGAAVPMAAAGLTVGKMREWVAEETGEEQLAFYTLQAKANPEDRWLDFVRPLDERVRSDDEEEQEEEEKEGKGKGKGGEGENEESSDGREDDSSEEASESASQWSETTTVASSEAGSQSRGWQSPKKDVPKVRSGATTATAARGTRRSKRSGVSPARKREVGVRTPCRGKLTDRVAATSSAATEATRNDGEALCRRRGRPRGKRSVEVQGAAMAGSAAASAVVEEATTKYPTKTTQARNSEASSRRSSRRTASTTSRRSTRVRTRVGASSVDEGDEEGEGGRAKEQDATGGKQENGEKKSEGGEGGEEEEELPVVTTLDELRRFVRLEGSVVGHGRCMWADTFAHHVVSRRLGLTILFVDMEREKSAWPYRVLARTAEDGEDEEEERFVVLKREPNHFVPVKTAPPPAEKAPPSDEKAPPSAEKGGGKAGDCGGDGVAALAPLLGWGQACFRRSELPEVVQKLWQIEPKVAGPVLPPPPEAGQSSTTAAAAVATVKVGVS